MIHQKIKLADPLVFIKLSNNLSGQWGPL